MAACFSDGAFLALAGVVATLFAADAYLIRQLRIAKQDTTHLDRYVSASVGGIRQDAALFNEAHREGIEALAAALAADRHDTETAAADARAAAQLYAARLARKAVSAGRSQTDWAIGELSGMRASASEVDRSAQLMASQLRDVRSGTQTVRAGSGRAETASKGFQTQAAELAAAAARQREALAAERAAGTREGFEFHLRKSPYPYAFKYFSLRLNKADPKHHRYSLDVLRDNRPIEAVDRTLNEPVRLVTTRGHVIELVIREIGKDEVYGSVAVPPSRQMAYSSGKAETDSFPVR
jgi:hypothetical protein